MRLANSTRFVCVENVQSETLNWLWPGRVALGKLTLIAGDPGLGKSFLSLDIAARVTNGSPWPNLPVDCAPRGSVILLSAEDDLADTIRPRLDVAGANLASVVALKPIRGEDNGDARGFALDRDIVALRQTLDDLGDCRLIVIDPISVYLGRVNANGNADVQSLLAPLAALAAEKHVAVVAITHLNKTTGHRAIYRAMGSLAFVAAARAAWMVMADPQDSTRRLLLSVKNNLALDTKGLAYRIVTADSGIGRLVWEPGEVEFTVDEVLVPAKGRQTRQEQIVEWLRGELGCLPTGAQRILREGKQLGFTTDQIFQASQTLGVVKSKLGIGLGWQWRLP